MIADTTMASFHASFTSLYALKNNLSATLKAFVSFFILDLSYTDCSHLALINYAGDMLDGVFMVRC